MLGIASFYHSPIFCLQVILPRAVRHREQRQQAFYHFKYFSKDWKVNGDKTNEIKVLDLTSQLARNPQAMPWEEIRILRYNPSTD